MEKLNRQVGKGFIGVEIVAIVAYYIAHSMGVNSVLQTASLNICSWTAIAVIIYSMKKHANKKCFRYIMLGIACSLYISMAIFVPINTGFVFGMCFTSIFMLYNDYKLVRLAILGFSISSLMACLFFVEKNLFINKRN